MKKLLTKVHWLCAVLLAVTLLQPGLSVAQKGGGGGNSPFQAQSKVTANPSSARP